MQTALITGANKGIGFEIARQLGNKGFHILVSGRSQTRLDTALADLHTDGISAETLLMDVTSDESVFEASEKVRKGKQELDVIINNAAILLKEDYSILEQEESIMQRTINTNCNGPIRVIRAFIPLLKRPGRIINISSGGGSMTDPVGGWSPAYCVSKSMLNALTRQLAFELREDEIAVNAVCPGWVRTDMGGKGATRSVQKGAETAVWLACEVSPKITCKFFRDKKEIDW